MVAVAGKRMSSVDSRELDGFFSLPQWIQDDIHREKRGDIAKLLRAAGSGALDGKRVVIKRRLLKDPISHARVIIALAECGVSVDDRS